jgi:hypothetical protein
MSFFSWRIFNQENGNLTRPMRDGGPCGILLSIQTRPPSRLKEEVVTPQDRLAWKA